MAADMVKMRVGRKFPGSAKTRARMAGVKDAVGRFGEITESSRTKRRREQAIARKKSSSPEVKSVQSVQEEAQSEV